MRNIIIYILILSSINTSSQSSYKIELVNSNRLISGPENSNYWICIGDVSFKHKENTMMCDSSHLFIKNNQINAFGNILLQHKDSLSIRADKLVYYGDKNKAYLSGNIVINNNTMNLTTSNIEFDINTEIIKYKKRGIIKDQNVHIKSNHGEYHIVDEIIYFKDSVILTSEDYNVLSDTLKYNNRTTSYYFFGPTNIIADEMKIYCENGYHNITTKISEFNQKAHILDDSYSIKADSIYYDKTMRKGKLKNNIYIINNTQDMISTGNLCEYFEKENKIEITKNPTVYSISKEDTLIIKASQILYHEYKKNKYMLADKNVKIFSDNLQSICDSLYYSETDSVIELYKNPKLWIDEIQVSSDTMQVFKKNEEINRIEFISNPIIISESDSNYFDQIKGGYMIGFLKNKKIKKLNTIGNGESIFLIKDEDNIIGINKVKSSNIYINFNNNKIENVSYTDNINSITIPFKDINEEDKYLNGFTWNIEQRPIKQDFID